MSDSLDDVLSARRSGGTFTLDVKDGWQQGRSTFGGVAVGAMVRAMEELAADPARSPRVLTAELIGQLVPGEARITVDTLRAGKAVTTLAATLLQGSEALAYAVLVLGAPRPNVAGWQRLVPPSPPAWESVEPMPLGVPMAPVFTQHFEFRTVGPYPFAAAAVPETSGWLRPRAASTRRDAAWVAALSDAWWSASAVVLDSVRPFATVGFTLEWFSPAPEGGAPVFHRATAPVSSDGYATEMRELWSADGRLLALNQQVVAVIK